jgi:D-beta-D-heptose 7-phosphate kinase/D-beta-D-heptose 1-phosphate adenosyltransferase
MLRKAKTRGDILVVGINGDRSVRHSKGTVRFVSKESQRAEVIASLECVDHAIIFNDDSPEQILCRLQPDIDCSGPDLSDGLGHLRRKLSTISAL